VPITMWSFPRLMIADVRSPRAWSQSDCRGSSFVWDLYSLQLRVLHLGFFQDGDVGVGVSFIAATKKVIALTRDCFPSRRKRKLNFW
jgi:hypothetical protein